MKSGSKKSSFIGAGMSKNVSGLNLLRLGFLGLYKVGVGGNNYVLIGSNVSLYIPQ